MTWRKIVLGLGLVGACVLVGAQGCGGGNGDNGIDFDASSAGDGNTTANNNKICLLNNCTYDRDCTDCTDGNTHCDQPDHRCVGCGSTAGGATCQQGQYCTQYGNCVPNGVTCSTDSTGNPAVACHADADCAACDPKHRVCDTTSSKCVGCDSSNVTNCQSTDVCNATSDTCVAACPTSCATDADCGSCGATGKEAHACNRHLCGQCSPTKTCPTGSTCDYDHGTCVKTCGLAGSGTSHSCKVDGDCTGCTGTTKCSIPIGGVTGTCAVPAAGCSDLGKGALALPAPFSSVTNTCSTDADCASVSTNIDVGQLLKDATGLSVFNSATFSYPEHACGSVDIPFTGSGDAGPDACGVCVPCKVDADCTDISIDSFVTQLLGPIGDIATDLILDKVFGPSDHTIHMYCENVAGNYGVCLPCSSILESCSSAETQPIPPNTNCDHDVCTAGDALGPACSEPTTTVCSMDPFCCITAWDDFCVSEVDEYSKTKACTVVDCTYKDDGTYCNETNPAAGYVCQDHSVALGTVGCMAVGTKCVTTDPTNIKSPARTNADGSLACQ